MEHINNWILTSYKYGIYNQLSMKGFFLLVDFLSNCLMELGRLFHNLMAIYEKEWCRNADWKSGKPLIQV